MSMKTFTAVGIAFAATALVAAPALAAVTFDPATGTGFVGKGDVQVALDLNNKQLQDAAAGLVFTYDATTVSETAWTCSNEHNDNVQQRRRTSTTTTSGVVSHVARERNQVTGFVLTGFTGSSVVESSDGPKLHSCPNSHSTYALDAGTTTEQLSSSGGLLVNGVALP